jgi:hypothetical protein
MVAVPAATPVTTPVLLLTVATPGESDVQVPPALPFLVNVTVLLEQSACVPLTVPANGATATVTVLVAVASAHPPVPVTV